MGLLDKIFGGSAGTVVEKIGNIADKFITTKQERAEFDQKVQEALMAYEVKAQELVNAEIASARSRETDFVKSTGHIDWMMTTVGIMVLLTFIGVVYFVATQKMPEGSEHLLINAMGILEGLVLSVVGYYFGSSAGSRVKDMRK